MDSSIGGTDRDPSGLGHGGVDWRQVLQGQKSRSRQVVAWLDLLGPRSGDRLVDVGCGPGFSSLMAAARVGGSGTVYAVDRSAEALTVLMEEARRHGLTNIVRLEGTVEEVLLAPESATHALLGNVLHHNPHPEAVVEAAAGLLAPGGRILVVEPLPDAGQASGRPRISSTTVRRYLEQAGLTIREEGRTEPSWYYLLATKPGITQ